MSGRAAVPVPACPRQWAGVGAGSVSSRRPAGTAPAKGRPVYGDRDGAVQIVGSPTGARPAAAPPMRRSAQAADAAPALEATEKRERDSGQRKHALIGEVLDNAAFLCQPAPTLAKTIAYDPASPSNALTKVDGATPSPRTRAATTRGGGPHLAWRYDTRNMQVDANAAIPPPTTAPARAPHACSSPPPSPCRCGSARPPGWRRACRPGRRGRRPCRRRGL